MMFVFAINRRVFCEKQRPMLIFFPLFAAVLGGKYDVSSRYSAAGSLPVITLELIELLRSSWRFRFFIFRFRLLNVQMADLNVLYSLGITGNFGIFLLANEIPESLIRKSQPRVKAMKLRI